MFCLQYISFSEIIENMILIMGIEMLHSIWPDVSKG